MWASFGYFEAAENERVLGSFARRLRRGGRLVLDIHNRTFFEERQGTREPVLTVAADDAPSMQLVFERIA